MRSTLEAMAAQEPKVSSDPLSTPNELWSHLYMGFAQTPGCVSPLHVAYHTVAPNPPRKRRCCSGQAI